MKKKYKEPWIKALRSGEFKQGQTLLFDPSQTTYCCLGVLAKINGYDPKKNNRDGEEYLDTRLEEKFGLDYHLQMLLGKMNDGSGGERKHTFDEIADYIEEIL